MAGNKKNIVQEFEEFWKVISGGFIFWIA